MSFMPFLHPPTLIRRVCMGVKIYKLSDFYALLSAKKAEAFNEYFLSGKSKIARSKSSDK